MRRAVPLRLRILLARHVAELIVSKHQVISARSRGHGPRQPVRRVVAETRRVAERGIRIILIVLPQHVAVIPGALRRNRAARGIRLVPIIVIHHAIDRRGVRPAAQTAAHKIEPVVVIIKLHILRAARSRALMLNLPHRPLRRVVDDCKLGRIVWPAQLVVDGVVAPVVADAVANRVAFGASLGLDVAVRVVVVALVPELAARAIERRALVEIIETPFTGGSRKLPEFFRLTLPGPHYCRLQALTDDRQ